MACLPLLPCPWQRPPKRPCAPASGLLSIPAGPYFVHFDLRDPVFCLHKTWLVCRFRSPRQILHPYRPIRIHLTCHPHPHHHQQTPAVTKSIEHFSISNCNTTGSISRVPVHNIQILHSKLRSFLTFRSSYFRTMDDVPFAAASPSAFTTRSHGKGPDNPTNHTTRHCMNFC